MATANDLINRALRTINVLASGETPTAAESSDSLTVLNSMIDAWQAERLMVFTVQRIDLGNLTIGQQAYELGTGAPDFNIARPARIERYGIISLNNPSQPLELPLDVLTVDDWASIPVKNIQSALPLKVWDDGGYPYRTLSYWCIPSATVQATIYPWVMLSSFPNLTQDVEFPPGYNECVVYNLAIRMTMEFGGNVPQWLPLAAQQALARVKSINVPLLDMSIDPSLTAKGGYYNWISDQFGPGPR